MASHLKINERAGCEGGGGGSNKNRGNFLRFTVFEKKIWKIVLR